MSLVTKLGRALLLTAAAVAGVVSMGWAEGPWSVGGGEGVVTAELSEDGTLTISGEGTMRDWRGLYTVPCGQYCINDYYEYAPWYSSRSSITKVVIEKGVTSIGRYAFYGLDQMESITIPEGVTSIGWAFSGCTKLVSIDIPNSVTSLDMSVFERCTGLKSVTIGNGVTEIGSFKGLTNLTTITIGDGVTSLGSGVFEGCTGLTSVNLGKNVETIGYEAFKGCTGLTSITLPNSVTSIEERAFEGCTGLTSFNLPNSVTSIKEMAFEGCTGLTSFNLPNSVTSIGDWAFSGCTRLVYFVIPNSVTSLGSGAFSGCTRLSAVKIGTGVTSIERNMFESCASLTSITIPASVTSIGQYPFKGCIAITSLTSLSADPPTVTATTFDGINKATCKLIVNQEDIGPYRAAMYWKDFTNVQAYVSVASSDRVVPQTNPIEVSVIAPVNRLSAEFTAGPNPAGKSSDAVSFFRSGSRIESAKLYVYDASGNMVRRISVGDKASVGAQSKRQVGSWDLTDKKGRPVSDGTYLLKGVIKSAGGKSEKVALVLGVR